MNIKQFHNYTFLIIIIFSCCFNLHAQKMIGRSPVPENESFFQKSNLRFFDTIPMNSIRKEKKHNKTIGKLIQQFGDCWADSLMKFHDNPSEKTRNNVFYTTYSISAHSFNKERRLNYNLFFNSAGYVIKKRANVRSNKRRYIEKIWLFNDDGRLFHRKRIAHKKTKKP